MRYPHLRPVYVVGVLHQKFSAIRNCRRKQHVIHGDGYMVDALDQFQKGTGEREGWDILGTWVEEESHC